MSARTIRTGLLAATAVALATLSLTACEEDEVPSEGAPAAPSEDQTADTDSESDEGSDAASNGRCAVSTTETTVEAVPRPINHLLVTVTNTGSENCDLIDYPALRFEGAPTIPPAYEDSIPQALVTLAPGESGYAGVTLSTAEGLDPYTSTSVEVSFHIDDTESTTASLPEGEVVIDESAMVTYWQQDMDTALLW